MRDLEYVNNDIKRYKEQLGKVDSLRLGMLLKSLHYLCKDVSGSVSDGVFKIKYHCHDTGISTNSYIIKPDGELYEFAQRTYWYNESQYGHNKWYYTKGAWDKPYEAFIQTLRDKLTYVLEDKIIGLEDEATRIKNAILAEKLSVESMFT